MIRHSLVAMLLLSACSSEPGTHSRTLTLDDHDHDGLLEVIQANPDDPSDPIIPEPIDCPVLTWREVTGDDGTLIQICTQCWEADGVTPIGPEVCTDDPVITPDIVCQEVPPPTDSNLSCWQCTDPEGNVVDEGCVELPRSCTADSDCNEGEECAFYATCGDGGDPSEGGPADGEPTEPPPPPDFGQCVPRTISCAADADCPAGTVCYVPEVYLPEDPNVPPPPPTLGICAISAGEPAL